MKWCEHCGKRVADAGQREQIRKLADGTRTISEIAAIADVTYDMVYQQIHREELAAARDDRRDKRWERFLFASEQRAAGKTLSQIGAALGVTKERARQMVAEVQRINDKVSGGQR